MSGRGDEMAQALAEIDKLAGTHGGPWDEGRLVVDLAPMGIERIDLSAPGAPLVLRLTDGRHVVVAQGVLDALLGAVTRFAVARRMGREGPMSFDAWGEALP